MHIILYMFSQQLSTDARLIIISSTNNMIIIEKAL